MRVRFLADANLDRDIVAGILRREPEVDFELPQGIIPGGMRTMPRHFGEFIAKSESPGLILVPRTTPIALAIDEILLIWHVTEAEEWANRFRRLPL